MAKKPKSAATKAAEYTDGAARKNFGKPLTWVESIPGQQWVTDVIPPGEACTPRIKKSSKSSDGKYVYFCYRNGSAIDVTSSLDLAKAACVRGTLKKGDAEATARILGYVTNHALEIPPFLALTDRERRAVRASYPMSAPSPAKLAAYAAPRKDEDPGTVRLRAELVAAQAAKQGSGAKVAKPATAALAASPDAVLARLRDGNPKKPGSAAARRWSLLFEHCDSGSTVKVFEAAGGNAETLANAISKGWVKLGGKK